MITRSGWTRSGMNVKIDLSINANFVRSAGGIVAKEGGKIKAFPK